MYEILCFLTVDQVTLLPVHLLYGTDFNTAVGTFCTKGEKKWLHLLKWSKSMASKCGHAYILSVSLSSIFFGKVRVETLRNLSSCVASRIFAHLFFTIFSSFPYFPWHKRILCPLHYSYLYSALWTKWGKKTL